MPSRIPPAAREPGHHGGVLVGHVLGEQAGAAGGAHGARRELVLHRERHAMQRSQRRAALHRRLGPAGGLAGGLGSDRDVGAQPPVEAVDTLEVGVDQLDRRDLPGAHQLGQAGGAQEDVEAHGPGC